MLQAGPYLGFDDNQHLIDQVQLPIYPIFTLIQVLDVEFDNVGDGIDEHEEAAGLLDWRADGLACIDEVEDRGQYFIHALNILHFRVDLGIDIQDS